MNTECNCATCRRKQSESQLAQAQARIAELEQDVLARQALEMNADGMIQRLRKRIADLEAALEVIRDSPYRAVEDCAYVARTALEKKP